MCSTKEILVIYQPTKQTTKTANTFNKYTIKSVLIGFDMKIFRTIIILSLERNDV